MAVMSPVSAARFTPRPRNPALVVRFRAQISPPKPPKNPPEKPVRILSPYLLPSGETGPGAFPLGARQSIPQCPP